MCTESSKPWLRDEPAQDIRDFNAGDMVIFADLSFGWTLAEIIRRNRKSVTVDPHWVAGVPHYSAPDSDKRFQRRTIDCMASLVRSEDAEDIIRGDP